MSVPPMPSSPGGHSRRGDSVTHPVCCAGVGSWPRPWALPFSHLWGALNACLHFLTFVFLGVVHIAPRDAPSRRASLVWGPVAVGVAVQGDVRTRDPAERKKIAKTNLIWPLRGPRGWRGARDCPP